MDLITFLIDFMLHLDIHLPQLVSAYGPWIYAILFLIVFCETGLVVTPFLPGDSLLFVAGALAAMGQINPHLLVLLLTVAAILSGATNYAIGRNIGMKLFKKFPRILKPEYLERSQAFYKRHGGRTIILARFMPIVRTFAPFVAGISKMHYSEFLKYNVVGAVVWVVGFTYAGYFFGNLSFVRENLELLIFGIILASCLPGLIEVFRHKRSDAGH